MRGVHGHLTNYIGSIPQNTSAWPAYGKEASAMLTHIIFVPVMLRGSP
jgi:hypothetical protein